MNSAVPQRFAAHFTLVPTAQHAMRRTAISRNNTNHHRQQDQSGEEPGNVETRTGSRSCDRRSPIRPRPKRSPSRPTTAPISESPWRSSSPAMKAGSDAGRENPEREAVTEIVRAVLLVFHRARTVQADPRRPDRRPSIYFDRPGKTRRSRRRPAPRPAAAGSQKEGATATTGVTCRITAMG